MAERTYGRMKGRDMGAADLFAQSIEQMVDANQRLREADERLADARQNAEAWQRAREVIRELEENNAANLAEKYALRQQLARYCPEHPLLKNRQLVEKVQGLGIRAFAINKNFDDARAAGETYFPPGTPPIQS